jgi:hypothetical protein
VPRCGALSLLQKTPHYIYKDKVTGKITIANVPRKFNFAPSGKAEAESDHMAAATAPVHPNNSVRAASAASLV